MPVPFLRRQPAAGRRRPWAAATLVAVVLGGGACGGGGRPMVVDEARARGLTAADFPPAADDHFHDLDGGLPLTREEVEGRNTWLLWTAGNEAFWDHMARHGYGAFDLLKLLSSHPSQAVPRSRRFRELGLANDPGFVAATSPGEHGLWLDRPVAGPEPFDPRVYGLPSGVLGLRLFPNPRFDDAAAAAWDPERYFADPAYYLRPDLERPWRVGMACAFCHLGPDPVHPPADPENPRLAELSSHVGAQYLRPGRVFANLLGPEHFVWQTFNAMAPGTVDTSLVASDNLFNPRTMNALYELPGRLAVAVPEELAGGNLDLPGTAPRTRVPHVLKDGADSVGLAGALGRVYFSIGCFHQEWLRHFQPLLGLRRQTPMRVAVAAERSTYWQATVERLGPLAAFLVRVSRPHRLADAPGGTAWLTAGEATLARGRDVFAATCAGCHSSKRPAGEEPGTPGWRRAMAELARAPDFLEGNYLSDDRRHPVTRIGTNSCASLASNALAGHVWEDFSSRTYKGLPAVGEVMVWNPWTGEEEPQAMPGGGRGYLRTPSLVSLWSTAPLFHDNGLGRFSGDPSVAGRMAAFDDAMDRLLWPARRAGDDCEETWGEPFCGPVPRTTRESWLTLRAEVLPASLARLLAGEMEDGALRVGPVPEGTPVALLASLDLELTPERLPRIAGLLLALRRDLGRIERQGLGPEESREVLRGLVPRLRALGGCLDYRVDRGHTFGAGLPDADKRALIEFLKTV